ncbi:FAD-dependent oxidoreductase [Sphingobacteriaceae bacterium]|nr:FAD-dependent oxidoreductase [Sphingobacteriaceae bacterium]
MLDFIIVGRGLAATTLAHSFETHNLTFNMVGDENLSACSKVAAGIWNPVVFKRLTKSWLADEVVDHLNLFYSECESRIGVKVMTQRPILKPFTEDQEKALWLKKARTDLENFLDEKIHEASEKALTNFKITNGYGLVKNSGNLNVVLFLEASSRYFKDQIRDEVFDYHQLEITDEKVSYKGLEAKTIIFCEGYLVKNNPFFNWIPLKPAKGEIITIKAEGLTLKNEIFNRNGFLMDVSEETYKVGATYAWDDLTDQITSKGLEELKSKTRQMIQSDYSVVKHEAGVRPSSLDRRPIIGNHPFYKNAHVFNGLGTKGVMLAPYFSKNYVNFYLQKEPLHTEVDVKRFYHFYGKEK